MNKQNINSELLKCYLLQIKKNPSIMVLKEEYQKQFNYYNTTALFNYCIENKYIERVTGSRKYLVNVKEYPNEKLEKILTKKEIENINIINLPINILKKYINPFAYELTLVGMKFLEE